MDTVQCVQPGLFGDEVERTRLRRRIVKRIQNIGKAQHQYTLKIRARKTPRVIDFKPRLVGEQRSNSLTWDINSIVRMHMELIRDWEEHFVGSGPREEASYWLWMLGDPNEDFSFRTCLILTGFTNPDVIIDAVHARRPEWLRSITDFADDDAVAQALQRHFAN